MALSAQLLAGTRHRAIVVARPWAPAGRTAPPSGGAGPVIELAHEPYKLGTVHGLSGVQFRGTPALRAPARSVTYSGWFTVIL